MARTACWPALALTCCVLCACAGDLEDPERFEAPSTGPSCDLDVMTDIVEPKCGLSGCHGGDGSFSAGLDLVSEGQASRLVGVPATAGEAGECEGRVRLDPTDPSGSLLVGKLREPVPCGSPMPVGGRLSDEEYRCMVEWAEELAGMAAGDGGVVSGGDGGGAGGGDAGSADGGT